MSNEELFNSIKQMIVDQLGVDEDTITEDSSFVDDLNADSLDMVELVMAMEQEFDIEIEGCYRQGCSRVYSEPYRGLIYRRFKSLN